MSCKSYAEHTDVTKFRSNPRRRTIAKDYGLLGSLDGSQSTEITICPREREKGRKREREIGIQLESPINTRAKLRRRRSCEILLGKKFCLYAGIPTSTQCTGAFASSRVQTKSIPMETSIKYERTRLFHVFLRVYARERASSRLVLTRFHRSRRSTSHVLYIHSRLSAWRGQRQLDMRSWAPGKE